MQIECQKCKSKYRFNQKNLSKDLVRVKCPKCEAYMIIKPETVPEQEKETKGIDAISLSTLQEKVNALLLRIREKDKEIERIKEIVERKDEILQKIDGQLKYKNEQLVKMQHLQEKNRGFISKIFHRKKRVKKTTGEDKGFEDFDIEKIN